MFVTPNLPALFKKATLKLVEENDTTTRAAEVAVVFSPFHAHLAREMGEDIAGHLFDDDDQIRPELSSVTLRPRVGALRVSARPVLDMDAIVIEPVGLVSVVAKVCGNEKSGLRWLELTCTLLFSLESKLARDFVLDTFGRTRLWTFEPLQRDLLADAHITESLAKLAGAGGKGSSVSFGIVNPETGRSEDRTTPTFEDAERLKQQAADLRAKAGVV